MEIGPLHKLVFPVLAAIALSSCVHKPTYPSKPVIAYKDFLRYGDPSNPDSVELVVSFTDNEGDIGLYQGDTNGVFGYNDSLNYGNFWMIYYYWDTAGVDHWSPYDPNLLPPFDTIKHYYRVPPVLPEGDPEEPVKGLIYVKQNPFFKIHDKIMYVVYMYDRARHKSDTIHTPSLIF